MPAVAESWDPQARVLGYGNEREMLLDLYGKQHLSLSALAKLLGYSPASIRRRLLMYDVQLRSRGGRNRTRRNLETVPTKELLEHSPQQIAKKYSVHVATVYGERRRRRHEVLRNSANQPSREGCAPTQSHGPSPSVVEGFELSDLLQGEET